ncbi:MAG: hypothetical protein MJE68_11610, partial [Proteobacteria bacterium]|nr:hypothetical protein [Pseudomonadota bacterium]
WSSSGKVGAYVPPFTFLSVTRERQKSLMGRASCMPKSSGVWLSCETSHTIKTVYQTCKDA